MKKLRVTILGSTGSIGLNTLRVIADHSDRFEVSGLAAGSKGALLREQAASWGAGAVYLDDPSQRTELSGGLGRSVKVFGRGDGLEAFISGHEFDILVAASSGADSLPAVLSALRKGKRVALANKEVLVVAGHLVMEAAATPGASLLPVDSEHSAIFQCLRSSPGAEIKRLILTGSGGPLRQVPASSFRGLTPEIVTNHPKWKMGRKISADSATLMNKGLEIIEASWLFGVPIDRIDVLIHPEAVIHSMVEYAEGSVIAQLAAPDMRLPILYALCFPDRPASPSLPRIDFESLGSFTFERPDRAKFPCLDLAYQAARSMGSDPCVLSAADEVAVASFLGGEIDFVEIPEVIEKVLASHKHLDRPTLDQVRQSHAWAAEEANRLCKTLSSSCSS